MHIKDNFIGFRVKEMHIKENIKDNFIGFRVKEMHIKENLIGCIAK